MRDIPLPPSLASRLSRFRSPLPCHQSYLIKFASIDRLFNLELHVSEEGSPPPSGDWTDTGIPLPGYAIRFRIET